MTEESLLVYHKIEFRWKVNKFFDLIQDEIPYVDSPLFSLLGMDWCFRLHPDYTRRSGGKCVCTYPIRKTPSTDEHRIEFSVEISKTDGSMFKISSSSEDGVIFKKGEYVSKNNPITCLFEKLELLKSKDVVMPDGSLTFFCKVRAPDSDCSKTEASSQTSSAEGVDKLSENLNDLFHAGRFSDVKLKVKGHEFQAHKYILSARSSVFSSMFEHEMAESNSGVVDIADCESRPFKDFLLYLYTGKLDSVSSGNVVELYKIADKYNVVDLKEQCLNRLNSELSVDLICDVTHMAVVYNEIGLLKNATQFFVKHSREVFATEQWKVFMVENNAMAIELLLAIPKFNG